MSDFREMWDDQAQLQVEIGQDPSSMDAVRQGDEIKSLMLGLHEEVTELGRETANYKRHLLQAVTPDEGNVAEEVADCFKYLIAIAQLYGVSREAVVRHFLDKTAVVKDRARSEQTKLVCGTKLLCVDLDDVIADLSGWPQQLNELGENAPSINHQLLETYKDEFHSSGQFRDLPVVDGAVGALYRFATLGYTIVIVTARPHWQFKRIYADTLYWLNKHDIPRDLLLFNKDKVEVLHRQLAPAWPTAFIEDHPRNALALAAAGVRVLLYDREHNRAIKSSKYITRVHNWGEIMSMLNERAPPFS